jgi:hypothetical protein
VLDLLETVECEDGCLSNLLFSLTLRTAWQWPRSDGGTRPHDSERRRPTAPAGGCSGAPMWLLRIGTRATWGTVRLVWQAGDARCHSVSPRAASEGLELSCIRRSANATFAVDFGRNRNGGQWIWAASGADAEVIAVTGAQW